MQNRPPATRSLDAHAGAVRTAGGECDGRGHTSSSSPPRSVTVAVYDPLGVSAADAGTANPIAVPATTQPAATLMIIMSIGETLLRARFLRYQGFPWS